MNQHGNDTTKHICAFAKMNGWLYLHFQLD